MAEAAVGVTVVHRNQVHVTEDEAVVVVLLQGLHVADVEQLGPVKNLFSILREGGTRNHRSARCLCGGVLTNLVAQVVEIRGLVQDEHKAGDTVEKESEEDQELEKNPK